MTAMGAMPTAEPQDGHELIAAGERQWKDAQMAAALLAVDPIGLGGVRIRSAPGPVRDRSAEQFLALLPADAPVRKLPVGADRDRIIGGLDLAATLNAGRPVAEKGLLAEADGGVLIAPMAERMAPASAGLIAGAMDAGFVAIERSGVSRRDETQFCCVLYDEGMDGLEAPPQILLERVAFHIDLNGVSTRDASPSDISAKTISAARQRLASIDCPDAILEAMTSAGAALGVHSLRALMFAIGAARAGAALAGRDEVSQSDAETACCLVFGPRAAPDMAPPETAPPPDQQRGERDEADMSTEQGDQDQAMEDMLVATARAAALGWLLEKPAAGLRRRRAAGAGGKSGALVESTWKGRPVGARSGLPRDGARLDLPATLRAAAPWRNMRGGDDRSVHLPIYKNDLRIKRFKARSETLVIFAVDASGSSAMHRMAEAKGAVELLLADCYSRRDHVALIAFRGEKADLLLPPTRSLTRVRRTLSALPGGGGTPLAAGIAAAAVLAETEKRKGKTPFVVILSDGRGNIALSGEADRAAAQSDAILAGRRLRESGSTVLFFDTGKRPSPQAQALSGALGARYTPLPYADSKMVSQSVKQVIAAG